MKRPPGAELRLMEGGNEAKRNYAFDVVEGIYGVTFSESAEVRRTR